MSFMLSLSLSADHANRDRADRVVCDTWYETESLHCPHSFLEIGNGGSPSPVNHEPGASFGSPFILRFDVSSGASHSTSLGSAPGNLRECISSPLDTCERRDLLDSEPLDAPSERCCFFLIDKGAVERLLFARLMSLSSREPAEREERDLELFCERAVCRDWLTELTASRMDMADRPDMRRTGLRYSVRCAFTRRD